VLAARYEKTGQAHEVLQVREMATPEPGPGEVRVRVAVSGVNPTDFKSRAGNSGPAPAPGAFQIPNQDGAGTIDAVGEGIDPARIGQRVWVFFAAYQRPWGTAAQATVVPADHAVPLPDDGSFDLGASLGIPALTAHRCLLADGRIDGATVLVSGGAGSVGHAAIELGRWAGARVVSTVSSAEKGRLAIEAGAHAVVNYRDADAVEQLRAAAPDGFDRIVEVALDPNLELDLSVAAPNAVIASYAADGAASPVVPVRRLMLANLLLRFVMIYSVPGEALRHAVADVTEAVAGGALTTLPLHRFTLEQVAEAHDAVEAGTVGQVLIDVTQ
jgi:NADPH2:quinone reductase